MYSPNRLATTNIARTAAICVLCGMAFLLACTTAGKNLPVSTGAAVMKPGDIQEATLQVESFFFKPNRLEVVVNVPVKLTLKSGAFIIPHNFSLHAPEAGIDISQNIGHGKTLTVEFTPTKVGEYPFYCGKDSHAKKGMTGVLVVKPQQ